MKNHRRNIVAIDRKIIAAVWKELDEMKKLGVFIPKMAFVIAANEATNLSADGASVSDIASLCVNLG
jgi:hypothetical protein